MAAYNQALEIQPDYAEAIEYRAEAFLGLNRLDEVKEAYMQLFREDRERADELMSAMQQWVDQRQTRRGLRQHGEPRRIREPRLVEAVRPRSCRNPGRS